MKEVSSMGQEEDFQQQKLNKGGFFNEKTFMAQKTHRFSTVPDYAVGSYAPYCICD